MPTIAPRSASWGAERGPDPRRRAGDENGRAFDLHAGASLALSTALWRAVSRSSVVTPVVASAWWTSGSSKTERIRARRSRVVGRVRPGECGCDPIERVGWRHVHVTRHHRRRDRAVAVQRDAGTAELAALVVPEPDAAAGSLMLGPEALGGHAPDGIVRRDPVADLLQRRLLDVGERTVVEPDLRVTDRRDESLAELLVGDGMTGDLGGGADVLAHVLDDLVLELVVGHAHDPEVEIEVGSFDVQETAHADDAPEVAGGDAAELAAVPAQVGRALETHLGESETVQGVEHDRLEAGDLGVEIVVVARLGEHHAPHHRAPAVVEGRAPARERAADDLDAEPLARGQVQRAVDVVEPSDVQVRGAPHAGLEDGLGGVGGGAGEHRHLRVVLERIDGPAVDRAPGL